MTTRKRELLLSGGNTDPEQDNNWAALAGDGLLRGVVVHEETGFDLGNAADQGTASSDVTVPGVKLGDIVMAVSVAVDVQDLDLSGAVTAADTVTVVAVNNTGGAVDLGSTTLRIVVFTAR